MKKEAQLQKQKEEEAKIVALEQKAEIDKLVGPTEPESEVTLY